MPPTSAKNMGLTPAGIDLGLGTSPMEDDDTLEKRKKQRKDATGLDGDNSQVLMDLGLR